jgi:hypothetical protein
LDSSIRMKKYSIILLDSFFIRKYQVVSIIRLFVTTIEFYSILQTSIVPITSPIGYPRRMSPPCAEIATVEQSQIPFLGFVYVSRRPSILNTALHRVRFKTHTLTDARTCFVSYRIHVNRQRISVRFFTMSDIPV